MSDRPLTPRQLEVLQGLAEGLDNSEIAERLGVLVPTIKTHVRSLLVKLEARSRTHLVARAYALTLVTAKPPRAVAGPPVDPLQLAADEAVRRNHRIVLPAHLVAAVLEQRDSDAAVALRGVGVDERFVQRRLGATLDGRLEAAPARSLGGVITATAEVHTLCGRAEAFGAIAGGRPTAESMAVALVWHENPVIGRVEGVDVRRAVLAELRRRGHSVPDGPLPPLFSAVGQPVLIDHIVGDGPLVDVVNRTDGVGLPTNAPAVGTT